MFSYFFTLFQTFLETSTFKNYHSEDSGDSGSRRIEFSSKSATSLDQQLLQRSNESRVMKVHEGSIRSKVVSSPGVPRAPGGIYQHSCQQHQCQYQYQHQHWQHQHLPSSIQYLVSSAVCGTSTDTSTRTSTGTSASTSASTSTSTSTSTGIGTSTSHQYQYQYKLLVTSFRLSIFSFFQTFLGDFNLQKLSSTTLGFE